MLRREVDFAEMSESGEFYFRFLDGLTTKEVDEGIELHDSQGNKCKGKFYGIQSQRNNTLAVVRVQPETWVGGFPPENVRSLKTS